MYLQAKRDGATAKRFFRRLLLSFKGEARKIVTDKLRSYGVAHRELEAENAQLKKMYAEDRLKSGLRKEALEGKLCGHPRGVRWPKEVWQKVGVNGY